jgi:hypothetical protein
VLPPAHAYNLQYSACLNTDSKQKCRQLWQSAAVCRCMHHLRTLHVQPHCRTPHGCHRAANGRGGAATTEAAVQASSITVLQLLAGRKERQVMPAIQHSALSA